MKRLAHDPEKIKQNVPDYLRVPEGREPEGGELGGPEDFWIPPLDKYLEALRNLPESGGCGCHSGLLRVANYGRFAELSAERIFSDLRARVRGSRKVSDKEIRDAIRKAFSATAFIPRHNQVIVDGPAAFAKICERGRMFDIPLLAEHSPVIVDWPPKDDAAQILKLLYAPDDLLYIGDKFGRGREHIRSAAEWIHCFERSGYVPEHIVPNPLTGARGLTLDGKSSFRADSCVKTFKYVTVEFDKISVDKQIQFFGGAQLPVVALIHSGSKSIHGWIRADVSTVEEWSEKIEDELFSLLKPLGCDGSCKNESRLSRTPGHFRREKKQWQKILYLDPVGKALQP